MAEQLTVTAANRVRMGEADCWSVNLERADGAQITHVFPADTLAWRAAEYDIDIEDTATLLDIVLHEPYITDPEAFDPPAAAALHPKDRPTTLANAATRADARTAHLARIAHTKDSVVHVGPRPGGRTADPLDAIRTSPPDHARHREIRDYLTGNRDRNRRNELQRKATP